MARPKKITTEKLIEIIDQYVEDKVYIRKLKYSDLVKYANEIGYTELMFQDFSRNTEIKEYVENFNKVRTTPGIDCSSDCRVYNHFDVETHFDTFRGRERQLIPYLKMVQQSYKETYDRQEQLYDELQKLHQENKMLLSVIQDKELEILKQRKKYKELNRNYNNLKSKIKEANMGTINEYKYKCAKYFVEEIGYKGKIDIEELLKNFESDNNYNSDILTKEELIEQLNSDTIANETDEESDIVEDVKKSENKSNVMDFKRPESSSLIPSFFSK